jgi:hypothetical protein
MPASKFTIVLIALASASVSLAAPFELLTGVDVRNYPGSARSVAPNPGPGSIGTFFDGDRLAGSSDTGPTVVFQGIGTPIRQPNDVGAMSFLFRRGFIPFGLNRPFMGIEFLGGPLLDLDGDANNAARSLVPVLGGGLVELPGTFSFVDLSFNAAGGTVTVNDFDARGTNETGFGVQAEVGVTLSTIAGTTNDGGKTGPINAYDTRQGTLTAFTGTGGTLAGVYRIENLAFEFWNDSIDPNSGTAGQLGTLQHFVTLRGWLVLRNPQTCAFPTLAGQGLGGVLWPAVDASQVGNVFNTANMLAEGTAQIAAGVPRDDYSLSPNGTALAGFGGDLGAYLDGVVRPRVAAECDAYVYLEGAGFGINNSGDPIFTDTIAYDLVLVGQQRLPPGDLDGDDAANADDRALFVDVLLNPGAFSGPIRLRADLNNDCNVDGDDIPPFVAALFQESTP